MSHDAVNHPKHYVSHPSGVECITVAEHMGFNLEKRCQCESPRISQHCQLCVICGRRAQ